MNLCFTAVDKALRSGFNELTSALPDGHYTIGFIVDDPGNLSLRACLRAVRVRDARARRHVEAFDRNHLLRQDVVGPVRYRADRNLRAVVVPWRARAANAVARENVPMIMSGSFLIRLEDAVQANPQAGFQACLPGSEAEVRRFAIRAAGRAEVSSGAGSPERMCNPF
jgi:hypothetical protein